MTMSLVSGFTGAAATVEAGVSGLEAYVACRLAAFNLCAAPVAAPSSRHLSLIQTNATFRTATTRIQAVIPAARPAVHAAPSPHSAVPARARELVALSNRARTCFASCHGIFTNL